MVLSNFSCLCLRKKENKGEIVSLNSEPLSEKAYFNASNYQRFQPPLPPIETILDNEACYANAQTQIPPMDQRFATPIPPQSAFQYQPPNFYGTSAANWPNASTNLVPYASPSYQNFMYNQHTETVPTIQPLQAPNAPLDFRPSTFTSNFAGNYGTNYPSYLGFPYGYPSTSAHSINTQPVQTDPIILQQCYPPEASTSVQHDGGWLNVQWQKVLDDKFDPECMIKIYLYRNEQNTKLMYMCPAGECLMVSVADHIERHIENIHKSCQEKKHRCDICSASFLRKGGKTAHMNICHKEPKCKKCLNIIKPTNNLDYVDTKSYLLHLQNDCDPTYAI